VRLETFLVRIWTGADSDGDSMSTARQPDSAKPAVEALASGAASPPAVSMQGLVRHVRSGSESRFGSEAELLAVLRTSQKEAPPAPDPDVAVEPVATGDGR
jgi:hypothetical protein